MQYREFSISQIEDIDDRYVRASGPCVLTVDLNPAWFYPPIYQTKMTMTEAFEEAETKLLLLIDA